MDIMEDKTIENKKLSDFGFVKMSKYPTQTDLEEFKYPMYIFFETNLFFFNNDKNKPDIANVSCLTLPEKIELSMTGFEKIQDFCKDSIINKRYRLTEIKLAQLLEILDKHRIRLIVKRSFFKKDKGCTYIDYEPQQVSAAKDVLSENLAKQLVDVAVINKKSEDKPTNTSPPSDSIESGSKRFSAEINKSIQGFLGNLGNTNSGMQKTKVNTDHFSDESNLEENQLSDQLKGDLLKMESEYNTLFHSVQKTLDEIYVKGDMDEKKICINRLSELLKIKKTAINQIDDLLFKVSVNKTKREDLSISPPKSTCLIDIDLAGMFPERQLDLLNKLQRTKLKTKTDLVPLLTKIVSELNLAIFKTNQLFCPYSTLNSDVEPKVLGYFTRFAQQFIETHTNANQELLLLRERIKNQLNFIKENGYWHYVSEELRVRADNFAHDKNGIYFNEIANIKQEIENKTKIALKIEYALKEQIYLAKNKQTAMAELELYLSFGIDFCDLKNNFLVTKKKCEGIEKSCSASTPLEFESMKQKSDYFMRALRQEQVRRQQKIQNCETFIDSIDNSIDKKIAPSLIVSLITNLKYQINQYKSCDISTINFIKYLNFAMQVQLAQENLQNMPFYGSQNKEVILDSFGLVNNVVAKFASKNPDFFSREVKEIEHARIIEQLAQVIARVVKMLEEELGGEKMMRANSCGSAK